MTDELAQLTQRLQRLEDREAIRELILAYRRCIDEKDFEGYADLFTADGEWFNHRRHVRGREEILGLLHGLSSGGNMAAEAGVDFHLVGNTTIEIELGADTATALSTWLFLRKSDENAPYIEILGHYKDVLKRVDGKWLFAQRDATSNIPVHAVDEGSR